MSMDFSATWVRATATGLEGLRADYEDLALEAGGGWFRIDAGSASEGQNVPAATLGASRAYGETVFLRVSAVVGAFEYAHADGGTLCRHIQYIDGAWRIVDGVREPWETDLLPGASVTLGAFDPMPSVERLAAAIAKRLGFRLLV
jgi:hypothetical protein